MYGSATDCLDNCLYLCNRLRDLQDQDSDQIAVSLQGEQLETYRKIMKIEEEKLDDLKQRMQSLYEASMLV